MVFNATFNNILVISWRSGNMYNASRSEDGRYEGIYIYLDHIIYKINGLKILIIKLFNYIVYINVWTVDLLSLCRQEIQTCRHVRTYVNTESNGMLMLYTVNVFLTGQIS
jgi:hypothetical protein